MYESRAAVKCSFFAILFILSLSVIQSSCENANDDELDEGLEWPIFKAIVNASSSIHQISSVDTEHCVRNEKGSCVKEVSILVVLTMSWR